MVASDLIGHGFAAALHGDYPSVDDWGQAVVSYGRDYMTSGAGEIQKRLAADLIVLQQQLGTSRFWAAGAKLATLYGKTFPGADGTKALTWYRHAAMSADRSGDDREHSVLIQSESHARRGNDVSGALGDRSLHRLVLTVIASASAENFRQFT